MHSGRVLITVCLATGAALRLVGFLRNRSLALDEARLSLNIASRSYGRLLPPLDHDQSAPLLFLWAERAVASLLGVSELSLRLLPLLAGLGVLVLTALVARRLLGPAGAVLATGMAAVSTLLLDYSIEVKQYSVEALVTLVLLLLALGWLEDSVPRQRSWALPVAGLLAVWFSGSAIFVLVGVAGGLFLHSLNQRGNALRVVWWSAAFWVASFAVAYTLVYRNASENSYMSHFWAPTLLGAAGHEGYLSWLRAIMGVVWGYAAYPFELPMAVPRWYLPTVCFVLLAVALLGLREMGRRRGATVLLLLAGPLVAVVFASALGFYPLGLRLMLFAIPLYHVCLSAGVLVLATRLTPRHQIAGQSALSLLILLPQLRLAIFTATTDLASAQVREAVAEWKGLRHLDDPVYLFARSIPEWTFYTTDWERPDTARLQWLLQMSRPGGPAFENAPSRRAVVTANEGIGLERRSAVGQELLGLPTGMEWLALKRVRAMAPDTGWASREATRIQAAATPGVWVLMSTYYSPERQLLDSLTRRGGRSTYSRIGPKLALIRYEFLRRP